MGPMALRGTCNLGEPKTAMERTQPSGAGTKGSLSSQSGWDAVISWLRPEPHVLRAENLCVKRRFRCVVRQSTRESEQRKGGLSSWERGKQKTLGDSPRVFLFTPTVSRRSSAISGLLFIVKELVRDGHRVVAEFAQLEGREHDGERKGDGGDEH